MEASGETEGAAAIIASPIFGHPAPEMITAEPHRRNRIKHLKSEAKLHSKAGTTCYGVLEDLRYAAGVLRRTPALTAVAVLTLALGIAATTTVFGWIDGMVLHPFRGATDDGQLAVLESVRASGIEDS